jgi:hypothetical protein
MWMSSSHRVAISAFLPWASFLRFSKSGIEGDGIVTLVLAIVGLALIWRSWGGWMSQVALAALVVLIGLYDLNEVGNLAAIGLYLTFVAGIAWVVGAFMMRSATSAAGPASSVVGPPVGTPGTT